MKRAIFFVLLLALELTLISQNLVVNPGFETWEKTTKPTPWSPAESCQKDSVNILNGNYSCKQTGSVGDTKSLAQKLTVTPGKKYMFSLFYKTVTTGNGHGCRIWCNWIDSTDIDIDDPLTKPILQSTTNYLKSDLWQQFFVDITAPANANYFYLEVRTYQYSIAYWDDFVFAENVATYDSEEKFPGMMIYPNPARDYLTISNIQNLQYIDIQGITGISLWSSKFSGEQTVTIPVSGLDEGLYIIRIRTSDKLITRKFIKNSN